MENVADIEWSGITDGERVHEARLFEASVAKRPSVEEDRPAERDERGEGADPLGDRSHEFGIGGDGRAVVSEPVPAV